MNLEPAVVALAKHMEQLAEKLSGLSQSTMSNDMAILETIKKLTERVVEQGDIISTLTDRLLALEKRNTQEQADAEWVADTDPDK